MWYNGTYSCGHEGRVNIVGPTRQRNYRIEREFEGLCPECYKAKLEEDRKKENEESAKKSLEMELPELTGTEKQVAWANTLRIKIIEKYEEKMDEFDKKIKKCIERGKKPKLHIEGEWETLETTKEELSDSADYAIRNFTEASFWIDNRNNHEILAYFIETYRKQKEIIEIPEDIKKEQEEIKKNLTVAPECEERKSGVAKIEYEKSVYGSGVLCAVYVKDEDFIDVVKSLGYKWVGIWQKTITEYTGTIENRAAELGNELLLNGFTVQFPNVEVKEKAISGDFDRENDRWIKWDFNSEKFSIEWKGRNNTLFETSKKIPSARWSCGSMEVKIDFYKEVLDFAETMGFSMSRNAKEKIEGYKEKENGFDTAEVKVKEEEYITDRDRIEKSLKSDGTIIKDLVDE